MQALICDLKEHIHSADPTQVVLVDRTSLLFEGASVCIGQMKSKCHTDLQVEASKMAPRNFSLAVSLAKKMGYSMPSLDLVESSKVKQNQF